MDLKNLQRKAKQLIDKRGGTESLKEDAQELRDIARGGGSTSDKAKRAADALKHPGAPRRETPTEPQPRPDTPAEPPPRQPRP